MNIEIRKAKAKDLSGVNNLLHQVLEVHAKGRPDIFKAGTKKYTDEQVLDIFQNEETPVFVAIYNENVVGYCFLSVDVSLPMLVESIAHYGLHSCVAPVVACKVDIVEISAHGYRQLVVDRHGVHQGNVLLKAGSMMGTFAKLCKHRGS